MRSGELHGAVLRSDGLPGGNLRSGELHGGAIRSGELHGGANRSDGLQLCSDGLHGGNPQSGELHGGSVRSDGRQPAPAKRCTDLNVTDLAEHGLPLLQPLPHRWSSRPRGLRFVTIVTIVDTIPVRIVNIISNVKRPVVASRRPWQASGCGTLLRTRRLLAPGAAPHSLCTNTFGIFIGTDNTFGIFIGTYTYGVFIGTQHHRAAAVAALVPAGELARPLLRYALVLAAVAVLP